MSVVSCSRCSAPLSIEAARGHAPCGNCGMASAPLVNPYAPQTVQGAWGAPLAAGVPQAFAPMWICAGCRHENQARYEFCLGCGGGRGGHEGAAVERGDRYEGRLASSPRGNAVVIVVIVGIIVAIAITIASVVVVILARA